MIQQKKFLHIAITASLWLLTVLTAMAQSDEHVPEERPTRREKRETPLERANRLYNQSRWPEALQEADEWLSHSAPTTEALLLRGMCRKHLGYTEDALADFRMAQQLRPEQPEAALQEALLLYEHKRYAEALVLFERLTEQIARHPNAPTQMVLFGGTNYGGAFTADGVFTLHQHQSRMLFFQGLCHAGLGHSDGALRLFTAAIQDMPAPEYFVARGQVYMKSREWEAASQDFRQALSIRPGYAQALYQQLLLESRRHSSRPDSAALHLALAQADSPSAELFATRGLEHLEARRYGAALADLDTAFWLGERSAELLLNRAIAKEKAGRATEALADLEQAIREKPDWAKPYFVQANVHFRLKAYEKALAAYHKAIARDPYQAAYFYNRALAFQRLRRQAEACEDFQTALRLGMEEARAALKSFCR